MERTHFTPVHPGTVLKDELEETRLSQTALAEAAGILKDLGVEHYIVAYDCDPAGKKGIVEVATRVGGQVH